MINKLIKKYAFDKAQATKIVKEYNLLMANTTHEYTIDDFVRLISMDKLKTKTL